ncbi:MAG: hypothetical protein JNK76_25490 [Planctomycetales bacterium]|nr:hypothetical protein [Planctomycetales bacterium]MBN8628726.1 hypothetical protein [Planctomycetota bacterium]
MRRFLSLAPAFALVVTLCGAARGQDLPTTHDHGITIGPDQLIAAIQESTDFWGPVRVHLQSPECGYGSPEDRAAAVAFLKRVHDGLHKRLFESTEADAMDLVDYLGHRLRMFEVYRGIRTAVGNDALTAGLIQEWEAEFRKIHTVPAAERAPQIQALLTRIEGRMKAAALDEAKVAAAQKLWVAQADVVEKMAATGAGTMMIDFEKAGTVELTIPVGQLLLDISGAADWVLIVREPAAEISCEQFVKAMSDLADHRVKYATASQGTTTR